MTNELSRRWTEWERQGYPAHVYPPGALDSEVDCVDLALTDGDAAAVFYEFFMEGKLNGESKRVLRELIADLSRVLPELDLQARPYFSEALGLLEAIQTVIASDP